jgi:GNAT superfamily N-acetyltransferase
LKNLLIRRARREDAPGFLKLLVGLANFEHLEPPNAEARKRIIRDIFQKRVNLFLAIFDGKPVGYALYFYTYSSFLARPTLYLEDIFVLEEHRHLGIGRELFLRCVREAHNQGCGRMEWAVLTWNKKAIRFYEKMRAKRLKDWYVYRLDAKGLTNLMKPKS